MPSRFARAAICPLVLVACTSINQAFAQRAAYDFEDRIARVTTSGAINRMCGWEFTANAPLSVSHLGYFDAGNAGDPTTPPDGLFRAYQMGVWRPDGTLLTQGAVQQGTASSEFQSYRYADVPDVTLEAGQNYIVAGFLPEGNYQQQTYDPYPDFGSDWIFPLPGGGFEVRQPVVDYEPEVTLVQSRYALFNASFTFPDLGFAGDNLVGAANFRFTVVPEPGAFLLLSAAAVGWLIRKRPAAGTRAYSRGET
jgi:hypothetical protein